MRTVRIPAINWEKAQSVRVSVPVVVDWPELLLTEDQIVANAIAKANNQEELYPDHSMFVVEIERPKGCPEQ
jgi:hypothetical protein